jgi:pSer/pThr/pTyr-binding forkhead associated (FHA) protein
VENGKKAEFQIEAASVSDRHCDLILEGKNILLQDKGSLFGTYINDNEDPVDSFVKIPLEIGDSICVGILGEKISIEEVVIAVSKVSFYPFKFLPMISIVS